MDDNTPQEHLPGESPATDAEAPVAEKAEDAAADAHRQRRMFFITFGSIVFAGLALTILYLGGRVMETRAAPKPPAPVVAAKPADAPVKTVFKEEAKKTEVPKPQLVVENRPAPAPIKSVPVIETKPVPAPSAKPVVADVKPAPQIQKPLVVAKAEEQPKPETKLPLVAKAEPIPAPPPPNLVAAPPAKPAVADVKPPPQIQKPLVVAKAKEQPKPETKLPLVAKAEPKPAPPPANTVAAPPAAKRPESNGILQRDAKPYNGPFLKPQPGQVYVQVGAYSPNYTGSFLAILEKKGFHGVVAAGPSQDVNRVLVGPFADASAVKNTNGELGKAGLNDSFPRKY
jgi:hypothetical protein